MQLPRSWAHVARFSLVSLIVGKTNFLPTLTAKVSVVMIRIIMSVQDSITATWHAARAFTRVNCAEYGSCDCCTLDQWVRTKCPESVKYETALWPSNRRVLHIFLCFSTEGWLTYRLPLPFVPLLIILTLFVCVLLCTSLWSKHSEAGFDVHIVYL